MYTQLKRRVKELAAVNYKQVLIVFLAFLTMAMVSYFYVHRIAGQQVREIGEKTMDAVQISFSSGLREAELLFSNVAYNVAERLEKGESNEEILKYLQSMNDYYESRHLLSDFLNIYAYIRGEHLSGAGWTPPPGYSDTERPWYVGAVANGNEIYYSNPYISADSGRMTLSISRRLFDSDGNSYGVLAVDIRLTHIIDYISRQEISNNGYGILLDGDMRFITHRDHSMIGVAMNRAGGSYTKLAQMLSQQSPISAERFVDSDGADSIAFFRPVVNGWHIGIVVPRASFYEQVYHLGVVIGGLGFVLMLVLSCMLIRLHSARIRSEEENRSKSSFLAKMSHEMRTPLNAVIGMAGIARKTEDPDEARKCLDQITDSAGHLLGAINDILNMSRIEAGKLKLTEGEFQLRDMINQVTDTMSHSFSEKHQSFSVHMDEEVPPAIISDQQLLSQVIVNLLSNAVKYTRTWGSIQLSLQKLWDTGDRCGLQIEIEDNGIGISEEQKRRLFTAFEQGDNSISREYEGIGLGLAISKNIIKLMNGEIWVESTLGMGSRFVFTIDVGTAPNREPPGLSFSDQDQNHADIYFPGKRILLADDVEINRNILIALLDGTGVAVDCAKNGREACELFSGGIDDYDMIFMDIHMPEMDGYEAAKRIRAMESPKARSIPIIAVTADSLGSECLLSGMNGCIEKPVRRDIVLSKMRQYLR